MPSLWWMLRQQDGDKKRKKEKLAGFIGFKGLFVVGK
jgi:hypothetical protein